MSESKCRRAQAAERGIAGAEIIQVEADVQGSQARKNLAHRIHFRDQRAFGEFQMQAIRRNAGFDERFFYGMDDLKTFELFDGNIDVHRQWSARELTLPGFQLCGSLAQNPGPHGKNQAGILRDGNEN